MEAEVIDTKLKYKRENHTSQLIDNDTIIVAGGWNGHETISSIEILKYEK